MAETGANSSDAASAETPAPSVAADGDHVFVCYSHKDAKTVYADIEWLTAAGCTLWYDKELNPGAVWRSELAAAIEHASVVLFYASPDAVASEHCSRELNYALDCDVPVIPIYLGETTLSADLRLALSRVQAIHRHGRTHEEYRTQLLSALGGVRTSKTRVMSPPRSPRRLWMKTGVIVAVFGAVMAATYFLSPRVSEKARVQIGDPAAPSLKSLAVLPFDNLSGDPEHRYFAEGLQDALIGELAQIKALRVISRTSTLGYADTEKTVPEIAGELGVGGIVEASVMRADGKVRIQVQLIGAFPEERHLWASSFDADVSDILSVQSQVAQAVAEQVGATLSDDETRRIGATRKVDPEAYDLYLRGMAYVTQFTPQGILQGISFLERAAELSPDDPLPFTGLAIAYGELGHMPVPPDSEAFPKSRIYALNALDRDDAQAGAHLALAEATLYYDWNLVSAKRSFENALALDPNSARAHAHYGWLLDAQNKFDAAQAELTIARDLAPLEPLFAAWLGWWHLGMGQYDEALKEAEASLKVVKDFPIGLYVIGAVYAEQGRFKEAIEIHERLSQLYPGAWDWALGRTYVLAARNDQARDLIAKHQEDNAADAWARAIIHEAFGEKDEAFAALQDAARNKHSFIPWFKRNYAFPSLRDDPRVGYLTASVNFGDAP